MSAGLRNQIENKLSADLIANSPSPWQQIHRRKRWLKTVKARKERRRANGDVECQPEYRRYHGYEY